MLPKLVQQVFDEHEKKCSKEIKAQSKYTWPIPNHPNQPWADLDFKAAGFEDKQFRREMRLTRYWVMGTAIVIGILQAIYFTYLLS